MHENRGRKLDIGTQAMIRRLAKHTPLLRIARILNVSRNTVKKYLRTVEV